MSEAMSPTPLNGPTEALVAKSNDILPRPEFVEALRHLEDFGTHGILFLVGERFQGKTEALKAVRIDAGKPGVYSAHVCCTPSDTLDFAALGYSHVLARRLLQYPEYWPKVREFIKASHLLETDRWFGSVRLRFWSRSTREVLEAYFEKNADAFSEKDCVAIARLASVVAGMPSQIRHNMFGCLFDACHCIHIYADDVLTDAGSSAWSALRDFASSGYPGCRISLIVAVHSPSTFAEFYNTLVRVADRDVKIAYVPLNPMPVRCQGRNTLRGPLHTPTVPALIHPDIARMMSSQELLGKLCARAPYSQISLAGWDHTDGFNLLAAGLAWIFVRVSDQDIVQLSKAMKIGAMSLTAAYDKNPLMHSIDGKWEFIEGWRYFIAGKDYLGLFVECVQEHLVKLALFQFSDPPSDWQEYREEHTPRFAFARRSFLNPNATIAFRALLRAVRRLRTKKRSSGRDRSVDVAMDVFDHVAVIGPVRSDLAIPLCSELFHVTQRLEIVDFGLSSIGFGTGPLTREEHAFLRLASSAADRWSDTTVRQNIRDAKKRRTGDLAVKDNIFVSYGHNELLMLKLKNFLANRVDGSPLVLSEQPRRGLTVVEQLENLSERCWFAIVLMTKDDVQEDAGVRARQNVVHEIGFFQGKYGRQNVVLLAERGVEIFSNISGILRIEFDADHFEAVFDQLRLEIDAARP